MTKLKRPFVLTDGERQAFIAVIRELRGVHAQPIAPPIELADLEENDMGETIDWHSAIAAMLHAKERARESGARKGSFECPKCGKLLLWSAAPNGHTRGRCATPNCVSWIE